MPRRWSEHHYGYLQHLIEQSLAGVAGFGSRAEGRIVRIAGGLWHQNYAFWTKGRCLSPLAWTLCRREYRVSFGVV